MGFKKIKIYKGFERFWHWSQAILIIFLMITGFEIHGSFELFGFEKAVFFHRQSANLLLALIVFAVFWHLTTGEWKQYLPTSKRLMAQILYYSVGMFKGEKHPVKKTELSKLNPLQRLTYLGFKLILIPLLVISGLLYMFHKTVDINNVIMVSDISLEIIAFLHTGTAYLFMVFLIVHVYMTTTGHTPLSNIKAMITGYEELETDEPKKRK